MDTGGQSVLQARRQRHRRAFRPLVVWLPIAALLVAADAHLRLLKNTRLFFTVSVEGHPIPTGYSATLSGKPVVPGKQVVPGWRSFQLVVDNAEPVEQRSFIGYGTNDFGDFSLTSYKGALEIVADPPAGDLQVSGRWFSATVTNGPAFFPVVPAGDYAVTARYAWTQEQKTVHVWRGQTNRLEIRADVGGLDLAAEPAEAQFRLTSARRPDIVVNDRTPAHIRQLPSGEYQMRISRGDYLKESPVVIKRGETNQTTITFEYGQVQLVSDPPGATVYEGNQAIGETPKVFKELKPGQYRFRLVREGYAPAQMSFEVRGEESLTFSTNLINLRYTGAMAKARQLAGAFSPDYQAALTNVTEALTAQPGDAEALALKSKLEADFQVVQSRQAEAKARAEVERRNKLAGDRFKEATDYLKDVALFDTCHWTVQGKVTAVRAAIERALDKAPDRWTIQEATAPGVDPIVIRCAGKGITLGRRSCVILVSQVSAEEVHVYVKFWAYVLGNRITLNLFRGVSNDSYIPIHPQYYHPEQPNMAKELRQQLADNFWKNVQTELRSENGH